MEQHVWSIESGPPLPSRPNVEYGKLPTRRRPPPPSALNLDYHDQTYTYLPGEEIRHRFFKINEKPEEDGTYSGIYASEEVCKSQLLDDQDLNDIVRCINTAASKAASEMIIHVHACTIPKAKSECDLETLALLLDCDHKGLGRRITRVMTDLLIQTDMKSHSFQKVLSSLNALFEVMQKRAICDDSMFGILPIVILLLLVLHHQSLNHPDRQAIAVSTNANLKNYLEILDTFSGIDCSQAVLNLRQSLRIILVGLQEAFKTKRMSLLQLGNFREELHSDGHRKRLSQDFSKMTPLEHYSLLLGVVIQISQFPVTMETLDFLKNFAVSVVDYYRKKSTGDKHVYTLLFLTTRAIISTLEKQHTKHTSVSTKCCVLEKLCEILQIILCHPKIKPEVRNALQEEVTILMFHETGTVVKNVHGMLQQPTLFLNDTLLRYLVKSLETLSFTFHSTEIENSFHRWHTLQGTIVGHIHVSMHVFLPARESMLNGTFDIDTYRQMASKTPQTPEHYNTLKVLKKLSTYSPNEHVQRLFAFQTEPLPLFYMTETLPDMKLSSYLLAHRKDRKWISEKLLGHISLGAVKAIRYLHDAGLVHRNIVADSFRYRGTVVLSDFSIVKTLPRESDEYEDHTLQATNDIPIRWSPFESLCEDEFSHASDVWMFGQLLYEIFTHGCHPYTDIYGRELDDVMDLVLFHDLKPKWWPCTPRPIHDVIIRCVQASANERTSLQRAQEAIERWLETTGQSTSHSENISFTNRGSLYPELNPLQKEKPERGTTMKLKQLKSLDGNIKDLYYNTLQKQKVPTNTIKIKESDLTAPDHPVIRQEGIYLYVEEPVSKKFIRGSLDMMKSDKDFAGKQHIVNFPPQTKIRESTVAHGFTHTLLYRCFQGKSLLNIAMENLYGDPAAPENEAEYAKTIREMVSFVSEMHRNGWILRDICCSTMYKSKARGKVFMPRLGRFRKCQNPNGCITDTETNTDDRRNWMPVEVLQDKIYSSSSDVYMLAMTIYEFYESASLAKTTPIVNRLAAVPFATLDPDKLLDSLLRDDIPDQPIACPHWMYGLLKSCWNRDPTGRPSARSILEDIDSEILRMSDDFSELSCGNSSFGTNSARSTYATISSFRRSPLLTRTTTGTTLHSPEGSDGYIQTVYNDSDGSYEESSGLEAFHEKTNSDTSLEKQGSSLEPYQEETNFNSSLEKQNPVLDSHQEERNSHTSLEKQGSALESYHEEKNSNTSLMKQDSGQDSYQEETISSAALEKQDSANSEIYCSAEAINTKSDKSSNVISECGASKKMSIQDKIAVSTSPESCNTVPLKCTEDMKTSLKEDSSAPNFPDPDERVEMLTMGNTNTIPKRKDETQHKLNHAQMSYQTEREEVWV